MRLTAWPLGLSHFVIALAHVYSGRWGAALFCLAISAVCAAVVINPRA